MVSRTHKLITQRAQVCQELRAIVKDRSIRAARLITPNRPSNGHKGKEPRSSTYEKDDEGCTRLGDSKTCDHCEGQHNSPNNPARHAGPSPRALPPSTLPSATSSHASSEASSSSTSEPSSLPSCGPTGDTSASTMELSSFQNWRQRSRSPRNRTRGEEDRHVQTRPQSGGL